MNCSSSKTPTSTRTPDQHPLAHTRQLRRTGFPDTSYRRCMQAGYLHLWGVSAPIAAMGPLQTTYLTLIREPFNQYRVCEAQIAAKLVPAANVPVVISGS